MTNFKGLENKMNAILKTGRRNIKLYDRTKVGSYYQLGEAQTDQAYQIKKFIETMRSSEGLIETRKEALKTRLEYIKNKKS